MSEQDQGRIFAHTNVIDWSSQSSESKSKLTGYMLHTRTTEICEVYWQTVPAVLASTFSAPVVLYERKCIDHEK